MEKKEEVKPTIKGQLERTMDVPLKLRTILEAPFSLYTI